MVLRPNFLRFQQLRRAEPRIPRRASSHPTGVSDLAAGSSDRVSSTRKLYMRSAMKVLVVCMAWGMALGTALPALSQEPAQQQAPVIRTQVNLVNLFVTVRDKSKRIFTDRKQEDFKVLEDSQPQQIAFFSKEVTLPITLGMLLDTSGSEQYMLGAIQDAGGRFMDRVLRKGDEALIMSFDTDVDLLSDFTDDRGQLDRAIRKTRINAPMGGGMINPGPVPSSHVTGTAFYDAVYLACNEKLNTEAGRKAIVVVTDAQDEGSKVRIEEAIEAAQRTDSVIHVLLVADRRFGGGNGGVAKRLADETGGGEILVDSGREIKKRF